MAGKAKKNKDKNVAYQIEKQLRWELAQKRKKQRYGIIAVIICSLIVVGLAVTLALAYVKIPGKDDNASASPSASSESTPLDNESTAEADQDVPDNAGVINLSADDVKKPTYIPSSKDDWNIGETGKTHFKILENGDGDEVALTDKVKLRYVGWKAYEGTEFDSSWKQAADGITDFGANGMTIQDLIKGWQAAVPGTHVGDKLAIYIPKEDAYAQKDESDATGGDLVFYVQITEIDK